MDRGHARALLVVLLALAALVIWGFSMMAGTAKEPPRVATTESPATTTAAPSAESAPPETTSDAATPPPVPPADTRAAASPVAPLPMPRSLSEFDRLKRKFANGVGRILGIAPAIIDASIVSQDDLALLQAAFKEIEASLNEDRKVLNSAIARFGEREIEAGRYVTQRPTGEQPNIYDSIRKVDGKVQTRFVVVHRGVDQGVDNALDAFDTVLHDKAQQFSSLLSTVASRR